MEIFGKTPSKTQRWLLSVLLVLIAALSATTVLDQRAEVEYEKLFQRAFITFALARTINGVISVVQGTEIAMQPAGVGLTLTPGEILDPVNDLVERFSWIMMGATVSLGIQNVLLDISGWWFIQTILVVLVAWLLVKLWLPDKKVNWSSQVLKRLLLLLLMIRFAVPAMLIVNDYLYQQFLETRYEQSSEIITDAGAELKLLGDETQADIVQEQENDGGLLDVVTQAWSSTVNTLDVSGKVDRMKASASAVTEHLIELSVVFILQTGLIPIAFLWLFLQGFKRLFRPIKLQKPGEDNS